ncbi:hypothetical protein ACSBR2_038483 [Camellia fascicularis]
MSVQENFYPSYIDSSGLSGAIPSSFAALQNVQTVWASDTELNGSIPDFIGNWSKLNTLFLGSNKLAGTLPAQISTSLLNINLVANNFTVESSNNSSHKLWAQSCSKQHEYLLDHYYGLVLQNVGLSIGQSSIADEISELIKRPKLEALSLSSSTWHPLL